jgi:hypothetical protein
MNSKPTKKTTAADSVKLTFSNYNAAGNLQLKPRSMFLQSAHEFVNVGRCGMLKNSVKKWLREIRMELFCLLYRENPPLSAKQTIEAERYEERLRRWCVQTKKRHARIDKLISQK